jgi:hypothetical protein
MDMKHKTVIVADTPREVATPCSVRPLKFHSAILVYQGGIANVFSVSHISEVAERRTDERRLLQTDFRTAEAYCLGLIAAGVEVASMACNQAGNIAHQTWREKVSDAPFYENMRPVGTWY